MKLYYKLIDHRIVHSDTVDQVAAASNAIITVIYYSTWKKSIYLFGRKLK